MYQGLGQMLTKRLQHHQGCSEAQKYAYVIYGQPLIKVCGYMPRIREQQAAGPTPAPSSGPPPQYLLVIWDGQALDGGEGKTDTRDRVGTQHTIVQRQGRKLYIDAGKDLKIHKISKRVTYYLH